MSVKPIKIGTRGSALALRQVEMVRDALGPEVETETVVIKTSGDWNPADGEVRLPEGGGGKALFAKEIEEALLAGAIDCAVHSMKDMDSGLPAGLMIEHMLPREDPRDALISKSGATLADLPEGATVGTTSIRRQGFLLRQRTDLKIVPFRGNVGTRLEKLKNGEVDATLLAVAGLRRLGLESEITEILEPEVMLPSAGQGAVGIELRESDNKLIAIFSQLICKETVLCVSAERAALAALGGSCHTPVGAYAILENGEIYLRVQLVSPDGKQDYFEEARRAVTDMNEAVALGRQIGEALKPGIPKELL